MAKRSCSVEGCGAPHDSHGFCQVHAWRWRTHGSTDDPRRSVSDRLWDRVDKDGPLPERRPHLGPCWVWMGHTVEGYGHIRGEDGREVGTHVLSFLMSGGVVPDGWHVHHECERRACVNPSHLEARTPRDNTMDSLTAPGAVNARKTECVNGHPFDAQNTRWSIRENGRPRRSCKACAVARTREWRARLLDPQPVDDDGDNGGPESVL